ncbi:hypothetical protein AA0481_1662 [Acetobacter orientalis NRIC 0481]|nr:hypothetical protein AA0481_1662 [Acetobacter orientalis NRIC 0481]
MGRCAFKQTAAPKAKKGVSTKKGVGGVKIIRNMACGMAGYGYNLRRALAKGYALSIVQCRIERG